MPDEGSFKNLGQLDGARQRALIAEQEITQALDEASADAQRYGDWLKTALKEYMVENEMYRLVLTSPALPSGVVYYCRLFNYESPLQLLQVKFMDIREIEL